MSSKEEIDQESLIVMELANKELRQYLTLALSLISNKKDTFNNLDNYDARKGLLLEFFGRDSTKMNNEKKVSSLRH